MRHAVSGKSIPLSGNLNIPALAIMSNRITESQVNKITAWAKQLANGRVNLMFDNDPPGIEGTKEALWLFTHQKLDTRLVWSPTTHNGTFANKQPEMLTPADVIALLS